MDKPSTNMSTLNGKFFNMDLLLLAVSADISDAGLSSVTVNVLHI